MERHDETPLSEEERRAFEALPRERAPSELLEERTVRALRERGLLHGRTGASWRVPRAFVVGAVAASVALFAGGVAMGQFLGGRAVTDAIVAARSQTPLEAATSVQRAGSAYVTALGTLAQFADTSAGPAVRQGREAALAALYGAAAELARLEGNDPLPVLLREALRAADAWRAERSGGPDAGVVWF
ncbi:MAG: hypothetical protein ACE5HP_12365 [Gemmatimonadota bacterium]